MKYRSVVLLAASAVSMTMLPGPSALGQAVQVEQNAIQVPAGVHVLNARDTLSTGLLFCVPYTFGPGEQLRDFATGKPVTVTQEYRTLPVWEKVGQTWCWPAGGWCLNVFPGGHEATALALTNLTDPWYTQGGRSGIAYAQILQPTNTTSGLARTCDTNFGAPFTIYTNVLPGTLTTTLMDSDGVAENARAYAWPFATKPSIPWCLVIVNIVPGQGAAIYTRTFAFPGARLITNRTRVDSYAQWMEGAKLPNQAAIRVVMLTASTCESGYIGMNFQGRLGLEVAWKRALTNAEVQRLAADPIGSLFAVAAAP